jgi:hypothetical protein
MLYRDKFFLGCMFKARSVQIFQIAQQCGPRHAAESITALPAIGFRFKIARGDGRRQASRPSVPTGTLRSSMAIIDEAYNMASPKLVGDQSPFLKSLLQHYATGEASEGD